MRKFSAVEPRIPMEVAVVISGHARIPGTESTFTQNVSSRGARVISVRRWDRNDRLMVASPVGDFSSSARVAYCQPLREEGYAIGLEFLEPNGKWIVQHAGAPPARKNK